MADALDTRIEDAAALADAPDEKIAEVLNLPDVPEARIQIESFRIIGQI